MARESGTFTCADNWVFEAIIILPISTTSKSVLAALAAPFNQKRGVTRGWLVARLGKSEASVRRSLEELTEKGCVVETASGFFLSSNPPTLVSTLQPNLQPKLKPKLQKSEPENPVQDSLFEEHERRGKKLKEFEGNSLSQVQELENQKLELLQSAFGDDFKLIDEVQGRRDAWLGLSPETIAGAIEEVTGFENFRTALKRELDKLANVTPPQSAKRSAAPRPRSKPTSDPRQETPTPVPGEKSAAEVLAEQERVRLEDEAAPFELSEAGKRFLRRVSGEDGGGGGHAPKGRSPPPGLAPAKPDASVTRGDWFARLRLRKVAYG